MNQIKWTVLDDMNDDLGNPTCWFFVPNPKTYIYITLSSSDHYTVYVYDSDLDAYLDVKKFRSLKNAKNWVSDLLY